MSSLDQAQTSSDSREIPSLSERNTANPIVDLSNPNDVRQVFGSSENQGQSVISNSGEMLFSNPFGNSENHSWQNFGRGGNDGSRSGNNDEASGQCRHGHGNGRQNEHGNGNDSGEDGGSDTNTSTAQSSEAGSVQQEPTELNSIVLQLQQLEQVTLSLEQQIQQLSPKSAQSTDSAPATTAAQTTDSAPATTAAQTTDSAPATTSDASGFSIQNGQLLANGKLLAGVDVTGQYEMQHGPTAVAQQIAADFPGINVVRLGTSPEGGAYSQDMPITNPETVPDIVQAIAAFNAQGINVIIDNHSGDANNPDNVAADGNEAAWFAQIAQAEVGNNMVMFQTQNEPEGDPSTESVTPPAAPQ